VETDEVRHTGFVALPGIGAIAVDDNISERSLGARSAVGRFRAVIETLVDDSEVSFEFAGTPQEARRALATWTLDEFSFSVRPFNPHPEKLGEIMHHLMVKDHVGSLRAVAVAGGGEQMRDSHHGLIAEAIGLTEAGYGQYGAVGTTADGLEASISKPKFSLDRAKNLKAQAENRTLKVYVEKAQNPEEVERSIVKALIDLYGKERKKA
jgi:hypothetical protein